MHSLGVPPSSARQLDAACDPIETLLEWGRRKLEALASEGIEPHRVILDPGVGFGKSPAQNLELLRHAHRLHGWGTRILVGHSRKSFLAALHPQQAGPAYPNTPTGPTPAAAERDLETAILSQRLADQGIEYLRVHDPASQARALGLSAAWDGRSILREPGSC
jgi:2-amino-4-hydroxy-6-hydroxymethyldihydropteridine diphosphokinase/dihydropteroate synthase